MAKKKKKEKAKPTKPSDELRDALLNGSRKPSRSLRRVNRNLRST